MLLMDGFDFHLDIAASSSSRGCEGKKSVFVLSFKQLNEVNTNVMLKQY